MAMQRSCLADQILNHVGWFNTGQLLVEPLRFDGESLVVDSQQMQDGGVEVANVDGVFNDIVGRIE